ncbi:hypothetical protein [Kitasatospora sp. NPDC059817]|uniref:hypothetical protein n=1 Tax=Kitasatospora sp. NPDC059817 TaxID=3346961 RepID=UPI0036514BC0
MITAAARPPVPRPFRRIPPPYVLGARWLASCNSRPEVTTTLWTRGDVAEVRVGVRFGIIRIHDRRLGNAALGQLQGVVDIVGPVGPVILNDTQRCVEFFVACTPTTTWDMRDSQLLDCGERGERRVVIKCPPPGKRPSTGRRWLVEPDGGQALTQPASLATALRHARRILRVGGYAP